MQQWFISHFFGVTSNIRLKKGLGFMLKGTGERGIKRHLDLVDSLIPALKRAGSFHLNIEIKLHSMNFLDGSLI
ncbi:hypothetical protein ACTHRH_13920 [Paenibacillus sp. SAFN-117]